MLGRGQKRKLSCFAEEEEEMAETTADYHEEVWAGGGSNLAQQRHLHQRILVLKLGLDKLQQHQPGMELRLHRSVLLVNTLRQIQEDMLRDGACSLVSPHPSATPNLSDMQSGTGLSPDATALFSLPLRERLSMEDLPLTCLGCAEADQLAVSLWDNPPWYGCPRQALHSAEFATSLGYLRDVALDDIFEDIDTSMYESTELPSGWAVFPSWAAGWASWGDEDVKMFSSCTSASVLPSHLTDVTELDHIMEILVNS